VSPSRAALAASVLTALAAPATATAQTVTLEADRPCYGPRQPITLTGHGFTPDGDVALSAGGQQLGIGMADYDGIFAADLRAPAVPFEEMLLRFTATDQTYLLNRASAMVRLTSVGVRLTPRTGDPGRPRRIQARGFFGGRTLYAHVIRGDRVRNVRVGRLRGACRRVNVSRRLFRPGVDPGAYKLHFDTNRRFVRGGDGAPRITYAVKIAASSSGTGSTAVTAGPRQTWRQLSP
jgi:hypothetical protein